MERLTKSHREMDSWEILSHAQRAEAYRRALTQLDALEAEVERYRVQIIDLASRELVLHNQLDLSLLALKKSSEILCSNREG